MSPRHVCRVLFAALVLAGGNAVRADDSLPPGAQVRLGTLSFRQSYRRTPAVYITVVPGGKVLATRSDTQTVRLWDDTGKLLQQLDDADAVTGFAFSPDGKTIVTAAGKSLRIWDVATGRSLQQWQAHESTVVSVAFTPDGTGVVSGGVDRKVSLWEAGTGKEARSFGETGKLDVIVGVAVSPDGKLVAAGGRRGEVVLWDLATGQEKKRLPTDGYRLAALAFAPDGKGLAVASKSTTRFWDVAEGKELRQFGTPVTDDVTSQNNDETLAFSPDGALVATGGKNVRIWETATGKEVRGFGESRRRVSSVVFLTDKDLASGGGDRAVRIWDTATGKETRTPVGHRDAVQCAAFSPDGKYVVTGGGDRALLLWDASNGKFVRALVGHESALTAVGFSGDSSQLASGDASGAVRIWDVAAGKEEHLFQAHQAAVTAVVFSPDGKALGTAGRDGKLRLYEVAKEREIHEFPAHANGVTAIAFSLDGKFMASGSGNGGLHIWRMDIGDEVNPPEIPLQPDDVRIKAVFRPAEPQPQPSPVLLLLFSPSGKQLTSWLDSGAIVVWDIATRKALRTFDGPSAGGTSAAFSADGKTLAARDKNNQITLRESITGQERLLLPGHVDRDYLWALAFAPDGRRLISACDDTTALIWDSTGNGTNAAAKLTARDLDTIWADLAHEKGDRAYRGIWALTTDPTDALPYLQEKLKPVAVDPKRLDALIADLDSNVFAKRQKAIAELEEMSELAEGALKKALDAKPPLEVKTRLDKLLAKIEKERNALDPHRLRIMRASEALEKIGTEEARKLLEALAEAPPELRLTDEVKREVRACLDRLASRKAKS